MNTVCKMNECAGCMACVDICPRRAVSVVDDMEHMNAVIDSSLCINCNACHKICQNNNPPILKEPIKWLQGWGNEQTRSSSSSGGFGQEVMRAVLRSGGSVAACKFESGEFKFELFDDESRIDEFIGSKYVKSNPVGIYKSIKSRLKTGKKVLFIGLPCQVASLRNYVNDAVNLYTIDLICHGSPSVKLLQKAVDEYGYDLSKMKAIYFRSSDKFAIETQPVCIVPKGVQDRYTMAFLRGLCYTDNCYTCHYAQVARTSDLTIGDSWGTEMTSELPKGVSLILCQTKKGQELLDLMDFNFFNVEKEESINQNKQLQHPSNAPRERKKFFEEMHKGNKFKSAVMWAYPKDCLKQNIKSVLITMNLWGGQVINPVYKIYIVI